jgi:cell division transport system permease protein
MPRYRHFDIPLADDGGSRPLVWIMALMVYLAILALAASLAMAGLAKRWDGALADGLTVEISPTQPDFDGRIDRAMRLLAARRDIADARLVPMDEARALLEPWLGQGTSLAELPIPALIDVKLAASADVAGLREALTSQPLGASVADPAQWLGELRRLARTAQALSILILALIGAAAFIAIAFAAKSGFDAHRAEAELLHLMGATDTYIARQFQAHILRQALYGAALGAVIGLASLLTLRQAALGASGLGLLPALNVASGDVALLASIPLVACLLAALVARITLLKALLRLP